MPHATQCTGTVTLYSDRPSFPKSEPAAVSFKVDFGDDSKTLTTGDFAKVVIPDIDVGLGPIKNTLTVTVPKPGTGAFDPATGDIVIEMRFKFASSLVLAGTSFLALRFAAKDPMTLLDGTQVSGQAVQPGTGHAVLLAVGRFTGAALDGNRCWVVADLNFAPAPI